RAEGAPGRAGRPPAGRVGAAAPGRRAPGGGAAPPGPRGAGGGSVGALPAPSARRSEGGKESPPCRVPRAARRPRAASRPAGARDRTAASAPLPSFVLFPGASPSGCVTMTRDSSESQGKYSDLEQQPPAFPAVAGFFLAVPNQPPA
ncbi:PREDICTED: myosin IC heavy chain-like, partial [Chinchilla lanigera]|uniref:myosin IC heavy chain-like n=1 Tax=Chinchilla lanigera TaxID=34839 RepID=UPI00069741E2